MRSVARPHSLVTPVLVLGLAVVACGGGPAVSPTRTIGPGGSTATAGGGSTTTPAGRGSTAGQAAGASGSPGAAVVEGSLTSTGPSTRTWGWQPDNEATDGSITLTSDKGTFAHIDVNPNGDIVFTSGDPDLATGSPYEGTGGKPDIHTIGGLPWVCGMTLDNDVKSSGGVTVHLKGTLETTGNIGDFAVVIC
jgi:hypothetical protein